MYYVKRVNIASVIYCNGRNMRGSLLMIRRARRFSRTRRKQSEKSLTITDRLRNRASFGILTSESESYGRLASSDHLPVR